MANSRVYKSTDAAGIEPKLIPDYELLARDDSGGPDYQPYTAQFGDGEFKQGAKPHLSADGGGKADPLDGTERDQAYTRSEGYRRAGGQTQLANDMAPASSKARAKE